MKEALFFFLSKFIDVTDKYMKYQSKTLSTAWHLRIILQVLIKKIFSTYIDVIQSIRDQLAEDLDKLAELTAELEDDLTEYGDNSRMNEKFYT